MSLDPNNVKGNPEDVMSNTPVTDKEDSTPAFDIQQLLMDGYVTEAYNKKHFNYKLRTLKNDEVMEIYTKLGKMALVSKAHADSAMELLFVSASVVEISDVKLEPATSYKTIGEFIDARAEIVKSWPGTMTDMIYADYTGLNRKLTEFLSEPEEIVKNS